MQNCTPAFRLIFLLTLIIIFPTVFLSAQKIITVAGNSNGNGPGYSKKYNPTPTSYGVAPDEYGNVFYSEIDKSTVTKIDVDGNVVLIAGMYAEPGFSGDGGLATNAKLAGPKGIYVAKNGNIYIADTYNQRVRKIDQNGIITTIAGGGTGGDGTLAINASLSGPVDVITDSVGNVYISEQGANKIRKVNTRGILSTVAGNGTAGFNGDSVKAVKASLNQQTGICFDENGNLIIADTHNHRIRKVNKNGIITTVAGNGIYGDNCGSNNMLATSVPVGDPTGVDVDTAGRIYILAGDKCYIQYIDKNKYIYNLASISNTPQSLAYSKTNNKLYYSTIYEDLCWGHIPNILSVDLSTLKERSLIDGDSHATAYNGDSIPGTLAQLSTTKGIAFINGNVYFIDAGFFRIRKIDQNGIITTVAGNGLKGSDGFGDGGPATNAEFNTPSEITADKNGNIFICDAGDNRIRKINKQGIITTEFKVSAPQGIAFDKIGNLFYSSPPNVYKIDTAGKVSTVAGDGSTCWTDQDSVRATKTCLNYPVGIYIDNDGNLYIADQNASKIRKVDTTGIITTIAGNTWYGGYNGDNIPAKEAWLYKPTAITKDKYGNLIITDNGNHRIRKIDSKGFISTIAGGGSGDQTNCDGEWSDDGTYSGDDDSAFGANLNYPYEVAFDKKGNYFISDQYNNRIREVITNCTPKPSPGSIAIQQYINKKFVLQYNCNLLATLTPRLNYLSALNTTVITNVWVEKNVIKDSSGKPFAPRHYQIFPERSRYASSTATFTLYFNQSDFDKYNSSTGNNYLKLPTSPLDDTGIANLMVYGYKAKSKDSSGLPDSYNKSSIKINPADRNIVWNNDGKYWEVSFDVNAFGGFLIGTEKKSMIVSDVESIKADDKIIKVYPNPATDMINVVLPVSLLYKPVQLFNADGKLMNTKIADAQNISLDLKDISAGIYIIRFADGTFKKVIVTKY